MDPQPPADLPENPSCGTGTASPTGSGRGGGTTAAEQQVEDDPEGRSPNNNVSNSSSGGGGGVLLGSTEDDDVDATQPRRAPQRSFSHCSSSFESLPGGSPTIPGTGREDSFVVGEFRDRHCPICLERYTENNPAVLYPCNHSMHLQCAEAWRMRNRTCPVCLRRISNNELGRVMTPQDIHRTRTPRGPRKGQSDETSVAVKSVHDHELDESSDDENGPLLSSSGRGTRRSQQHTRRLSSPTAAAAALITTSSVPLSSPTGTPPPAAAGGDVEGRIRRREDGSTIEMVDATEEEEAAQDEQQHDGQVSRRRRFVQFVVKVGRLCC